MESAWPRTIAASRLVILRAGSGSRALPGASPGRSAAKLTSSSGARAIARRQEVTARLNGSVGASLAPVRNLLLDVDISTSPPSSLRTQGPITTGGHYCVVFGTMSLLNCRGVWVPAFAGTTITRRARHSLKTQQALD